MQDFVEVNKAAIDFEKVGKRIQQIRKSKKITQADLASWMMAVLLGLSACGVSNITENTIVTEITGNPSQGTKTQNSATIQLLGESAPSTSDAVAIDGQTVTITDEGTY